MKSNQTQRIVSLLAGVSSAPCPGCARGLGDADTDPAAGGLDWQHWLTLIAFALLVAWAIWPTKERKYRKQVTKRLKAIGEGRL